MTIRSDSARQMLKEITPTERLRVVDVVRGAGVDVRDWGNYKRGKKEAAANPKYCYNWSFVQPKKVVVLCEWLNEMDELGGTLVHHHKGLRRPHGTSVRQRRARQMDLAIQTAAKEQLPIRVVVLVGPTARKPKGPAVAARLLDPVGWAVTAYDWKTGRSTISRGALARVITYVDQWSGDSEAKPPERRSFTGSAFPRDPNVRRVVLERAAGQCEWCGQPGFRTAGGSIYLETHHIIALSDRGLDIPLNVIALCPNHHREAHHGTLRDGMRKELVARVTGLMRGRP